MRLAACLALAAALAAPPAFCAAQAYEERAVLLIAQPEVEDLDYRHAVLIAAPLPEGGHIGLILNRPTQRSLASLFPRHRPSRRVREPVYYGGPFSRDSLLALVRSRASPGEGAMRLLKGLYLVFHAPTIDHVIETAPNTARYYVGCVSWRPGELRAEIERGLWLVHDADADTALRRSTQGLWEELLVAARRLRASAALPKLVRRD